MAVSVRDPAWQALSCSLHNDQCSLLSGGQQVDKDLRTMLIKPDAPAPKTVGVRVWPRAIPQFNLGHLQKVRGS